MKRKTLTFGTLGVLLSLAITGSVYATFIFASTTEATDSKDFTLSIAGEATGGANGSYKFCGGEYDSSNYTNEADLPAVTVDQVWYYDVPDGGTNPITHEAGCAHGGTDTTISVIGVTTGTSSTVTCLDCGATANISTSSFYTDFAAASHIADGFCTWYTPNTGANADITAYGPYSVYTISEASSNLTLNVDAEGVHSENATYSIDPWQIDQTEYCLFPTNVDSTYSSSGYSLGFDLVLNETTYNTVYPYNGAVYAEATYTTLLGYNWTYDNTQSAFYYEIDQEALNDSIQLGYYDCFEETGTTNITVDCDCGESNCKNAGDCSCAFQYIKVQQSSTYATFKTALNSSQLNVSVHTDSAYLTYLS